MLQLYPDCRELRSTAPAHDSAKAPQRLQLNQLNVISVFPTVFYNSDIFDAVQKLSENFQKPQTLASKIQPLNILIAF